jgi:hypothetical protein
MNETDYEYITNENGIVLTKYLGNESCVCVPSNINGHPPLSASLTKCNLCLLQSKLRYR